MHRGLQVSGGGPNSRYRRDAGEDLPCWRHNGAGFFVRRRHDRTRWPKQHFDTFGHDKTHSAPNSPAFDSVLSPRNFSPDTRTSTMGITTAKRPSNMGSKFVEASRTQSCGRKAGLYSVRRGEWITTRLSHPSIRVEDRVKQATLVART